MKICLVGEGAQGHTHIPVLQAIDDVEVASLACGIEADGVEFARQYNIPHVSSHYEECLRQDGIEAVVITSPNQLHCEQAVLAMGMGLHVLLELPMGLSLEEAKRVVATEEASGRVCMVCHTSRYNPAFRKVHALIDEGELDLHHIVQQTYFFRRINENRFGKPRIWTDDLLWHQACHMIDMVYWLLDDAEMTAWGQCGAPHPTLRVPMDVTLALHSAKRGCLVTSAQSFNNHGPIQSLWRFIGEQGTYMLEPTGLRDHEDNPVDLDDTIPAGVEGQDSEFFAAIREGRKALTSCSQCLPVMAIIDRVQRAIDGTVAAPSLGMVDAC
ncbi:MAG: Gfo/Idh/MocA family oxidoreductase [Candidatus Latescibacterota bacterium]|nr:Gfo/Idh/MocA family oxidoreductase [Candidatus Latescibacterota bacterium]